MITLNGQKEGLHFFCGGKIIDFDLGLHSQVKICEKCGHVTYAETNLTKEQIEKLKAESILED